MQIMRFWLKGNLFLERPHFEDVSFGVQGSKGFEGSWSLQGFVGWRWFRDTWGLQKDSRVLYRQLLKSKSCSSPHENPRKLPIKT